MNLNYLSIMQFNLILLWFVRSQFVHKDVAYLLFLLMLVSVYCSSLVMLG